MDTRPHEPAPLPVPVVDGVPGSRDEVFERVRDIYAEALEYPREIFEEDVALEADLGVDSVKQTELIGRLRSEYDLPPPPEDFRMSGVTRFGQVVDLVMDTRPRVGAGVR